MLKRVFPDRQHKTASRVNSQTGKLDGNQEEGGPGTSSSSSPLKSTASGSSSSAASSSNSSPIKSGGGGAYQPQIGEEVSPNNLLSKSSKQNSRSCSSTEFQSLKLESMSTVEDFKSVSKTISSALDREILAKQSASSGPSAGLANDALQECTTSLSTPSDEEGDSSTDSAAESLFKQQAKFFSQMKDYLLSQQSSLRQHLEVLNATVALRKKKIHSSSTTSSSRRHHGHHGHHQQQQQHQHQRFSHSHHHNTSSGHSVHSHSTKQKAEVTGGPGGGGGGGGGGDNGGRATQNNAHDLDLMNNEFHSCSSTEKSDDDIQVCPLCGVEIEDSENPAALEEHVASHWCSPDDPI